MTVRPVRRSSGWVQSKVANTQARTAEREDDSSRVTLDQGFSAVSRTVLSLPYDLKSPFLARRFVERFAPEQALDGTCSVLRTIATELVTNAVLHGTEPVEVTLHFDDNEVTVEVSDGDPLIDNVRVRALDQPGTGAYGLRIIASLADRWGTRSSPSGKTVWATVTRDHAHT